MAATLRELIREEYREYIRTAEMPEELRQSLRAHERIPRLVDNLTAQLSMLSFQVKKETVVQCVRDVSAMFVAAARMRAEQSVMSELAKRTLKKQAEETAQFQKDVATYDEKGAMHVIKESESFEEIRSKVGLRQSEYDDSRIRDTETREVQEQRNKN